MKKYICLFLCVCFLLMPACREQGGESDSASSEAGTQKEYSDMLYTKVESTETGAVTSLNGKWNFYADTLRTAVTYQAFTGDGSSRSALFNTTLSQKLTVKEDPSAQFVLVKARLYLDQNAKNDGTGFRIGVSANGGSTVYTDVSGYMNSEEHWIDLSVRREDLVTGENTITLSATFTDGAYLLGDGKDYSVRIKTCAPGSGWQDVSVPAACEGQISLSIASEVHPDMFDGIGWYQKQFTVSKGADGEALFLHFEAVDYKAEVFLNGRFLGSHEGGYTAFEFCLSELEDVLVYDGENTLTVRVTDQSKKDGLTDDDINIKETLAGFAQDTMGLNYSGIWQDVYLVSRKTVYLSDSFFTYDAATGETTASLTLVNQSGAAQEAEVTLTVSDQTQTRSVTVPQNGTGALDISFRIPDVRLWSAEDPYLYEAKITVSAGGTVSEKKETFGLRTISVSGTKIVLNGENIFLTGMLHWGRYYGNLTSAVSKEQVIKEITELKKAGFNAVKYCLICPPDYILDLYDEMGMYVYVEYPIWNVKETSAFFERARLQLPEMLKKDRKHPSVILSDFNCEDFEYTAQMDTLMKWCIDTGKALAPNRLYTDNSTNGVHKYGDFATCHPYYQVTAYPGKLAGWIEARGETPLILGEFADISVLRDLGALAEKESADYTWYHSYFTDFDQAEIMRSYGFTEEQIQFTIQSSVLNAQELRKFYLEESKKNGTVSGLFLTHISESANGWADGWFDDLGEPHFDSDVISEAAREDVLLPLFDTVNYAAGEKASFRCGASLYGGSGVKNAVLSYSLEKDGTVCASGKSEGVITLANGDYYELPAVSLTIPESESAARYTLTVTLLDETGKELKNSFSIWGYPQNLLSEDMNFILYDPQDQLGLRARYPWVKNFTGSLSPKPELIVTTELSGAVLNYLAGGGKVVYVGSGSGPVTMVDNWDYSRFSFIFMQDSTNPLVKALDGLGYGGLQFSELATSKYMNYSAQNGVNIIGRYATTEGTIGSYLASYTVGQGTLLQTTFRVNGKGFILGDSLITHETLVGRECDNVLGRYLVEQMIRYQLGLL